MKKRKLTKMSAVLLATVLSAATVFSGCNKKVDYDMGDGTQKEGSAGHRGGMRARSRRRTVGRRISHGHILGHHHTTGHSVRLLSQQTTA